MAGFQGKPLRGSGNDISGALSTLRQAKPGTSVIIRCQVEYPGKVVRKLTGVYQL